MKRRIWLWGGGGILLLFVSMLISLSIGTARLSLGDVWHILLQQLPWIGGDTAIPPELASYESILLKVRLPRIVLAILVGAALSLAGAGFQGVLRNPLADPYTLGVASGASVGAAFLILFQLQYAWLGKWTIPIVAFATGLATLWVVLRMARINGKVRIETVILSGVVVQAFLGAMVSFMVSMSKTVVNDIVFWMMGSLSLKGWDYAIMLIPYVLIGWLVLTYYARALNALALGEQEASYLGIAVEKTKLAVLVASTFMTAAAVSMTGVIGFVGLVVPHMVRLLVGPDYRLLVPFSAIFGGIYMLWADTAARTILSPTEIPLGVVTAFIGTPFFAYLLTRRKKEMK
ncbi:FecCD family ABC transporter permease [Marinicrinis lubricantis]|uniref:FecCD family ABC transporter permease n=1 Tax=Marinicrinis lubricantis TaxID=2086470 RepID=A0ABW1IR63_9BACL